MPSLGFLLSLFAISLGYCFSFSPILRTLRSRRRTYPRVIPDLPFPSPFGGGTLCLYGSNVPEMNWDPKAAPKLDFNEDYYNVLEVDPTASDRDLKKQYYKIVFKYHPDRKDKEEEKALSNKQMMVINNAYAILKEKGTRTAYDRKRKFGIYGKGNTSRPSSSNTRNTEAASYQSKDATATKDSYRKSSYSSRQATGGSSSWNDSRAATKDSYRSAYEYSKSAEQINERFRRQFNDDDEEFQGNRESVGDILEDMWTGINENPEQVMEDFMDFIGVGSGSFMEGSEDVMQGKYGAFWEEDDLGPRNSPRDKWKQQQSRTNTSSSRQENSAENERAKKRRVQEEVNKKIQKKKELTQEKQSLQSSLIKMASLVDELKEERVIEEKDLMRTKPKEGTPRDKVELELRLKRMEYVQVLSKRQKEAEARMANIKRQIRNVTELLSYIDL